MNLYRNIIIKVFASVLILMLVACSDDTSEDNSTKILMQVMPYCRTYVESNVLTRATLDGYENFIEMYPSNEDAIAIYLSDGSNSNKYTFTPPAGGKAWTSNVEATAGTSYNVYGFYPDDNAISASGTSTDWTNGATITLSGLNTFSTKDVCVISGVNSVGNFVYTASDDVNKRVNYLFLDHIYSCIRLEYRVDADYAELRTIKLKDVSLTALPIYYTQDECDTENNKHRIADSNGKNPGDADYVITYETGYTLLTTADIKIPVYSTQTATVTVTSSGPSVTWSDKTGSSASTDNLVLDASALELKPADDSKDNNYGFQQLTDIFTPATESLTFKIVSTYDVYDKDNTLIRKDCTATNTVTLGKNATDDKLKKASISAGTRNIIKLTVTPTYLYKLSQPDTDYPTIVLSN